MTAFLGNYLANPRDLIPDRENSYGLLDDSWLILDTALRLNESGILPAAAVPLDWRTILELDSLVQRLMAPQVLAGLARMVRGTLDRIVEEVQDYQPILTPPGNGFYPVMPAREDLGGSRREDVDDLIRGIYVF